MMNTETETKMTSTQASSSQLEDPFGIIEEFRNAPRPRPNATSNIVEFYNGRSVFITGASGFIGKVLIEKLLRTCPAIKRVFVLIRPKYNKQPHERLQELLAHRLFDGLRSQDQQQLEEKVCLVEGDITQENLGLNNANLARIIQEVSVIFHSAATVKFDDPLKQSVAINLTGTKNMINLCRRIPQLASLVHVSTAYANCDRDSIGEHIYPVDMDPERLIELADWMDQDTLQTLKARFLGPKPNTYTYTKALAEWLLVKNGRDLPVVICRPSIVVATANEPFKGWIDNLNGPTGVIVGTAKGLIRSMYAEREFVADLVPADKVINLIVSLGWFAHMKHKLLDRPTVGLDHSLTESDLLSGCSMSPSSNSGCSSAASTSSGLDDSMQEDELRGADLDHLSLESASRHHEVDQLDLDTNRRRNGGGSGGGRREVQMDLPFGRHNAEGHSKRDLSVETMGNSSLEDESADLSLSSECSSSAGMGNSLRDVHRRRADQLLGDLEKRQRRQQHDDGYSSRYANSVASSADMAEKGTVRRSRPGGCSKHAKRIVKGNVSTGKLAATGSGLIGTSSEMIGQVATSRPNELCARGRHFLSVPVGDEEQSLEYQTKLRRMRQSTLIKLNEKGLAEELGHVPVFHCTSGGENPLTWGQVQIFILAALSVFPSKATFRYPCGSFTNNEFLDNFYALTLHYLPAYFIDFLTRLTGGKPKLVKIFNKFHQAANVLKTFTSKQWNFDYDNRLFLMEELMNDEDRRLFDCSMQSLNWRQFSQDYVIGVRKFLLKEPISNLAEARRNLRFVYYRNLGLQLVLVATCGYYALSSPLASLWSGSGALV